ncbi:PREDICTED: BOI-related E3 ubiquitin-protein ligase 1-like, partial [Lupinus angustifolius]|uniref:BOI-related E3 ubiquitin-protein ligase 1-like n=1 Tax=Lupinus angustifolius TaxID=3871 RepID=UPI00092EE836
TATSSRKRGREAAVAGVNQMDPNFVNPLFSLQSQSQPPQQHNAVSTGLALSFGDQHQQLHNLPQHSSHSSPFFSHFSQLRNSQIKQHKDDIDQFLQAQGEELRHELAAKRQKHYQTLLNAAEESVARRLREKEAEVEKATRKKAELEARAAQLIVEAKIMQARVKAHEATAASLQAQLHHAIVMSHEKSVVVEDAESAEDADSAYVDPGRVMVSGPKCRGCDIRVASVVVLPCRHLCVCIECENHFRACPVCLTVKSSSIEVCLS